MSSHSSIDTTFLSKVTDCFSQNAKEARGKISESLAAIKYPTRKPWISSQTCNLLSYLARLNLKQECWRHLPLEKSSPNCLGTISLKNSSPNLILEKSSPFSEFIYNVHKGIFEKYSQFFFNLIQKHFLNSRANYITIALTCTANFTRKNVLHTCHRLFASVRFFNFYFIYLNLEHFKASFLDVF